VIAHNITTSAGGRAFLAEFFATHLRRHDFQRYIEERLAADFACALAGYLSENVAAIAAGGAQEAVGEILREGNDSAFKVSWLRPPGPNGTKLYAADPKAAATVAPTDARYIVIGYGETDHPQAAFINEREQLLDAVLGMMYTHASDADSEIRGAYAKDLADDDEWSEGIWSTEFEIGGITIYDLGYGSAASNGEQA
jgi:hypothetical protein